ncbi:uncharacterized protein KY384_006033 [Bacidia gigantensis]|uniref:uncharacterized protein n=1 Tax=Bacidia gigantensis TaxID=2732470 RepID=UPI001D0377A6|nr:uncharacterized protein KY384_006033 [Bacidia gigantensis]KAG8529397.1 hypothetical protein KY384_006033 [Bacidia gigantensis]
MVSQTDLEHVGKKLERTCSMKGSGSGGFLTQKLNAARSQRRARATSKSTNSNTKAIYDKLEPQEPLSQNICSDTKRHKISPDSDIPCDDPSCVITIPHNIGRYYAGGKKAENSDDELYTALCPPYSEPVSHRFNYTVPPPIVVEAYVRVQQGCSNIDDEDLVRNYTRMHIYSPIHSAHPTPPPMLVSEPVRTYCRVIDPDKHDEIRQNQLQKKLKEMARKELKSLPDAGGVLDKPGHRCEYERRTNTSSELVHPLLRSKRPPKRRPMGRRRRNSDLRKARADEKVEEEEQVITGETLQDVRLSIQERTIDQIAEQAISESGAIRSATPESTTSFFRWSGASSRILSNYRHSGRSSATTIERPLAFVPDVLNTDRQLELHAVLIRKLREELESGTFQGINLRDKDGQDQADVKVKHAHFTGLLLLVRRAFRELLGDLKDPYLPIGMEVTKDELGELCEGYLIKFEILQERYSHMPIKDVISSLDKLGLRARLSNLC